MAEENSTNATNEQAVAYDQQTWNGIHGVLSAMLLASFNILNANFQMFTGDIGNVVQLIWSSLLQAFYLSFEVIQDTSLSLINLLFAGEQRLETFIDLIKTTMVLILNIFKGLLQIIKNYLIKPALDDEQEQPVLLESSATNSSDEIDLIEDNMSLD